MSIKCHSPKGTRIIKDVKPTTTYGELKSAIAALTQIQPLQQKLLFAFPTKEIQGKDQDTLEQLCIKAGDSIRVEEVSSAVAKTSSDLASGIMLRREVPSDNSCLFNSIWYNLMEKMRKSPENGAFLRNLIAETVKSNPTLYNEAFLGMPTDKYASWILNPTHWGGGIELSILAKHFATEICVVDILSNRIDRFGESENYPNRTLLLYDGIHFDSLALAFSSNSPDKSDVTVFSSKDDSILEKALKIAREAKAERKYTDLAHFSLKCGACGQKLTGQKDAQDHAMSTGHSDFREV